MSPRAPSPPPRASICTAGARKDCFNGVLPAAGLGVVPTKQSIAEQARAKSTQASTREAERAMLQVLPHRELHRSGLQRGKAEISWSQNHRGVRCEYKLDRNNTLTPMYVLNWSELGIISQGHPSISHPAMLTCDQAQQITSLLPQNGIPLAFAVQTNMHWTRDPLWPTARRTCQHGKHAHRLSTFVPSKTLCLPKSQGNLLCQGQQIDPSDVRRLKTSISWPLPLSGLLMSSHGLKKPLMLANKDAIPNTVMPMM